MGKAETSRVFTVSYQTYHISVIIQIGQVIVKSGALAEPPFSPGNLS